MVRLFLAKKRKLIIAVDLWNKRSLFSIGQISWKVAAQSDISQVNCMDWPIILKLWIPPEYLWRYIERFRN